MFVNENNVVCNIKDIHLIINTENGAVVGVDDESLKQYQGISKERTFKITNRELYNFLLENNFISDNQFKYKDNSILTAYFHVTNHCNLHCLGCYSDSIARNKERDLSIESMLKILDELKTVGVQNIIISGGEPLIRKDIVDIVKYAKESCNMQRMILITNGTIGDWKLFKELALYLDTISVSIDTYSSECSAFLRDEGIFEKIILNIKQMRENGLNVSILPTIHHKNVKEMSKYIKLAESLGTEISFSIFTIPYLYVLSILVKEKSVFSIGVVMSLIAISYMWCIFGIFKRLKTRKRKAIGITFLLAIPVSFIINIALSKMILEPIMDMWDILLITILLVLASIFFIWDKKGK